MATKQHQLKDMARDKHCFLNVGVAFEDFLCFSGVVFGGGLFATTKRS